jgi:hypothetical protein
MQGPGANFPGSSLTDSYWGTLFGFKNPGSDIHRSAIRQGVLELFPCRDTPKLYWVVKYKLDRGKASHPTVTGQNPKGALPIWNFILSSRINYFKIMNPWMETEILNLEKSRGHLLIRKNEVPYICYIFFPWTYYFEASRGTINTSRVWKYTFLSNIAFLFY